MKTLKLVVVLFAFQGLILTSCSDETQSPISPVNETALEKANITNFTFSHYPIGLTGEGGAVLVGGNWIIKSYGVIETIKSSNPLVSGTMIHYLSSKLDAITGEGPIHGTWTLTPENNAAEGGVFEGNYTGYRSKMPGSDIYFILPLQVIGHGKGGNIDGMQIFETTNITAWGTPPVGWYGSGEGFYKSH